MDGRVLTADVALLVRKSGFNRLVEGAKVTFIVANRGTKIYGCNEA